MKFTVARDVLAEAVSWTARALPVRPASPILAGVRTLAVMSIATGSIAAFIGGGGLGEAIFRGITMYNVEMTFSGALLLVLLALACDYSLSFLEKHIKKKWRMN